MNRVLVIFSCMILFLLGCKKEKEVVTYATDVSFSAAQCATEMDAMFIAGYDFAKHFTLNEPLQVLPTGAQVIFLDSLFTDGNGIVFSIKFGALGTQKPFGLVCLDGKTRAGSILCQLNKPINQIGAVLQIKNQNSFYTGNGNEMFLVEGDVNIVRTKPNTLKLTTSLLMEELTLGAMSWIADLEISENNIGYNYNGSAKGLSANMRSFSLKTDKPLARIKNCTNTFTTGSCIINSGEEEEVVLDFNPYNQGECDRVARAMVKRFEKIFYIY